MKKRSTKQSVYMSRVVVMVPDTGAVLDMLRHDRAWPTDQDEARKLCALLPLGRAKDSDRVIVFTRASNVPNAPVDRWASFCCEVFAVLDISEDYSLAVEQALAELQRRKEARTSASLRSSAARKTGKTRKRAAR